MAPEKIMSYSSLNFKTMEPLPDDFDLLLDFVDLFLHHKIVPTMQFLNIKKKSFKYWYSTKMPAPIELKLIEWSPYLVQSQQLLIPIYDWSHLTPDLSAPSYWTSEPTGWPVDCSSGGPPCSAGSGGRRGWGTLAGTTPYDCPRLYIPSGLGCRPASGRLR